MAKYAVLVDTSGSMRCYLETLKDVLRSYWLDWLMGSPPANDVALISFNNDVSILSHYTQDVDNLKTLVDGLVSSGQTAFNDAILVGLVFEHPRADALFVWSDQHDTCSDASETIWADLSNALGVDVNLCPPYDWMRDPVCWYFVPVIIPRVVTIQMAMVKAKEIATRVKTAKVIEKPERFLKLKP